MPNSQISYQAQIYFTSPAKVNCHRKVKLTDATVQIANEGQVHKLLDVYIDIFSKHSTEAGKADLDQVTLISIDSIRPLY